MEKKKLFTKKLLNRVDLIALVGVLLGVVFIGQPLSKIVFVIAFPVILFFTALHMVVDHYI
jgi:divalent metal cation (Fe/Co/Zn/Cd) transporter